MGPKGRWTCQRGCLLRLGGAGPLRAPGEHAGRGPGNQGACVIAKSYEMKAQGVKTGMPIWEAQKLCPDGLYVKRDFRWYEVLSRMMLETVRDLSPRVEYYSIDEFFFDASVAPAGDVQSYAVTIRDRLMERVRVPVTVRAIN